MTRKRALLIVDMQEFFFQENPHVDKAGLVSRCQAIAAAARIRGVTVIHIWTVYRPGRDDWPRSWAAHKDIWCGNLVRGNSSSAIVQGIRVENQDLLIEKRRFSAFYNTELDDVLRNNGITDIDLIGYSADVCVRFTSVDAYNRGYNVTIIREGVEAFRELTEEALHYLQWTIDANVISSEKYEQIT